MKFPSQPVRRLNTLHILSESTSLEGEILIVSYIVPSSVPQMQCSWTEECQARLRIGASKPIQYSSSPLLTLQMITDLSSPPLVRYLPQGEKATQLTGLWFSEQWTV